MNYGVEVSDEPRNIKDLHTPPGHPWHVILKEAHIMAEPVKVSTKTGSWWARAVPSGEKDTWNLEGLLRFKTFPIEVSIE